MISCSLEEAKGPEIAHSTHTHTHTHTHTYTVYILYISILVSFCIF